MNIKWHSVDWPYTMTTLHRSDFIKISDLITKLLWIMRAFMCNGSGMPRGDAFSFGHLVLSHLGLAYVLLAGTNPFSELVVICRYCIIALGKSFGIFSRLLSLAKTSTILNNLQGAQRVTYRAPEYNGGHFFPIDTRNTNLVEGDEIVLPVKLPWIPLSGFRGEVENAWANQREGGHLVFPIGPKNTNLVDTPYYRLQGRQCMCNYQDSRAYRGRWVGSSEYYLYGLQYNSCANFMICSFLI